MKKAIFILLCSTLIVGCMASLKNEQGELKCSVPIYTIKDEIREIYNADSVKIYSRRLKEEIYFTEITCLVVLVYNAKTDVLDFKTLPTTYYQRFDNFEQIENELKKEGIIVAQNIIKKCDITGFNDLIIEFIKLDDKGKPIYRFTCHYKELLE
jgi:hypothetical protein